MANIQPSPPFNLAPHDYQKMAIGALYAAGAAAATAFLAYLTGQIIPDMQQHVANQGGVLIVAFVAAFAKWGADALHAFVTDTTKVTKLLILAVGLSLCSCGPAFAGESAATMNIPDLNTILGWFLSKWWGMPLLMFGVPLILTKVWPKINLYAMFGPLLVKAITWGLTPAPITPVMVAVQPPAPDQAK